MTQGERLARMEEKIDHILSAIEKHDARLVKVEEATSSTDKRLSKYENRGAGFIAAAVFFAGSLGVAFGAKLKALWTALIG